MKLKERLEEMVKDCKSRNAYFQWGVLCVDNPGKLTPICALKVPYPTLDCSYSGRKCVNGLDDLNNCTYRKNF